MSQLFLAVTEVLLQTHLTILTRTSLNYRFLDENLIEGSSFNHVGVTFLAEERLDTERLVVVAT